MKNKIWYEFVNYKYGDEYLILYLSRLQTSRKYTNIVTLVFSTSGVLGWTFWKFLPIVSCVLIAIIQIFKLIENQIIPSEKDIEQVVLLRNQYNKYWNQVEKLWIEYNSNKIDDDRAKKCFYKLRETAIEIEKLDNKLNIQHLNSLKKKAEFQTNNYLTQYHL